MEAIGGWLPGGSIANVELKCDAILERMAIEVSGITLLAIKLAVGIPGLTASEESDTAGEQLKEAAATRRAVVGNRLRGVDVVMGRGDAEALSRCREEAVTGKRFRGVDVVTGGGDAEALSRCGDKAVTPKRFRGVGVLTGGGDAEALFRCRDESCRLWGLTIDA